MDQRLADAFNSGHPLFQGVTLKGWDITGSQLLELNRPVLGWLNGTQPNELRILDDWHFHDGCIKESEPTSLGELAAQFTDEETMISLITDETVVYSGVYPADLSFFWRWGRDHDWDQPFEGSFDITAAYDLRQEIPFSDSLLAILEILPAAEYWGEGYTEPVV